VTPWLETFFDWVLSPLGDLTLRASIIVLGAVVGFLAAVSFRLLANQGKLRRAADQTQAELLAIKLFKHDPATVGRAEVRLMGRVAQRMWHGLMPTVVLAVPLTLLLIALTPRFEQRPLAPGEAVVVERRLSKMEEEETMPLTAPRNVRVETPPLRNPNPQYPWVSYRIRPLESGQAMLRWERRWSEARSAWFRTEICVVEHPSERLLRPSRGISNRNLINFPAVEVHYPPRHFRVAGLPWWACLILSSMIFAWLFGRTLGVRY
jgi:hypothetical protein